MGEICALCAICICEKCSKVVCKKKCVAFFTKAFCKYILRVVAAANLIPCYNHVIALFDLRNESSIQG